MKATVIIPAYNAEETVGTQLEALTRQVPTSDPFEVIVADNGSTDRTATVAAAFADRLELRIIDASARRGPAAARNQGAAVARGEVFLFCDADDLVSDGWVKAMTACVGPARAAVGRVSYGDRGVVARDGPTAPEPMRLSRYLGQVPQVLSGNLGLPRTDFDAVGGFDEALRCGEDADLGIRLLQAGCEIVPCPGAQIFAQDRSSRSAQFLQFVQYGRWDVAVYKKHRGNALRRPPLRSTLRDYGSLLVHLPRLAHPQRRRSWIVTAGLRCGRLIGSVRERTFLP